MADSRALGAILPLTIAIFARILRCFGNVLGAGGADSAVTPPRTGARLRLDVGRGRPVRGG